MIKQNIKFLCERQGLTYRELAIRTWMPYGTFKYRMAHEETFRIHELEGLAKVLGVSRKKLEFSKIVFWDEVDNND